MWARSAAGERPAFEREIDLGGSLVIPGFKNAHTHSAMTFLRSYADDLPTVERCVRCSRWKRG